MSLSEQPFFCIRAALSILIMRTYQHCQKAKPFVAFWEWLYKEPFSFLSHKLFWVFLVPNFKKRVFCQSNCKFTLWKALKQYFATIQRCTSYFWHIVMGLASQSGFLQRGPFGPVVGQCPILSCRTSFGGSSVFSTLSLRFSKYLCSIALLRPTWAAADPTFSQDIPTDALKSYRHENFFW